MTASSSLTVLVERDASIDCERILRSLPHWFGIEQSLREFVADTTAHPTFLIEQDGSAIGFATLRGHFPQAYELSCIAVHARYRRQGCGMALLRAAESWASARGAIFLQVKTLAHTHPSSDYAETRAFYARAGYLPLEVFPALWSSGNPCLQLIKTLST